jgi:hypothetical protein
MTKEQNGMNFTCNMADSNDLRGAVDDGILNYVLGCLLPVYSENITSYLNKEEQRSGNPDFDYATDIRHRCRVWACRYGER